MSIRNLHSNRIPLDISSTREAERVSPSVKVDADAGSPLVVPGAVGVPGEQTVRLRLIAAAVGQGQLQDLRAGADVQVLLRRNGRKKRERRTDEAEGESTKNQSAGEMGEER